jgi:LCP family protein required for cell wall assembly
LDEREIRKLKNFVQREKRKPRRARRILYRVLTVFLILTLSVAAYASYKIWSFQNKVRQNSSNSRQDFLSKARRSKPFNVLLIGADVRGKIKVGRSDTIIIARLDPSKKRAVLISIPRDTRVKVEGHGFTKINHSYAYGGVPLLIKTIKSFLNIEINHYAEVDFRGFKKIVDALGGVDIYVDKELVDQKSRIHIKPGLNHLKGEEALGYVRFRKDPRGDFGRIERQQKFFQALIDKSSSWSSLWRLPRLVEIVAENLRTDMSAFEMLNYARLFSSIKKRDLVTVSLPGVPRRINGLSYVIPDEAGVSEVLYFAEKYFSEPPRVDKLIAQKARVSVFNGTGVEGMARKTADHLRFAGFAVGRIGDYPETSQTIIVYNKETSPTAREVYRWLGFGWLKEEKPGEKEVKLVLGFDTLGEFRKRLERFVAQTY